MKKIRMALVRFIKYEGITAVIAAIVILVVCVRKNMVHDADIEIVDWTIFTSIVIALLLNSFSNILQKLLMNRLEDSVKLTSDYEKLSSKYMDPRMITYDNASASRENLKILKKNQKLKVRIPVIVDYKLEDCTIDIQDSASTYKLPDMIQQHWAELFAAHSTSAVYNQINIRVDDWEYNNKTFIIKTSRTTYFDSLVTNRAMDFRWENGMTIREQFECGPYIHTLSESCLSNHIGFNGFVESSDGYIVFVKRGNKLSIGKRTYGNSIGASLKTKYALNAMREFTENGLVNGILHEIEDELKIPKDKLENFSVNKHLIAAYRDMVEGGKPQLLFFIRSFWTKEEINQNFSEIMKQSGKKEEDKLIVDGEKFLWISTKELNHICIFSDRMIYQGKSYSMMPSAAASVVMLVEYLREKMQI